MWRMPTRPHAKGTYGSGQETKWYTHIMTFLVTQEVSLMAFVKFHNSLSSLGNAILAFRARKQWYLFLNESGPHSRWMWAILLTSGIHLFNHKMSVKTERIQWRKWYSRPAHVSWLGIWSKEIENDWKSGESYCWRFNEDRSKARQCCSPFPDMGQHILKIPVPISYLQSNHVASLNSTPLFYYLKNILHLFLLMSVCVCLLSVCGLCACPPSLGEGTVRSAGARVTGRCELSTVGPGSQTPISARAASAFNHPAISTALIGNFWL